MIAAGSKEAFPAIILNRYRVAGALGQGGDGIVLQAFDETLKRTVAIKTYLPEDVAPADPQGVLARLTREAEVGARIPLSAHVLAVHDLATDSDGHPYLILEYAAGGTLADRLRHGPLPLDDTLRIAGEIARGLRAAHAQGIVHRDIKPGNVFFAAEGHAKIGDFGVAQIEDLSRRTHATVAHPGTPLYMSPEQAQTTGYVRPSSDQYSLGLVLFEMLTGAAYKRLEEPQVDALLAQQPAAVAGLVRRLTAPRSADRFPSLAAVLTTLQALMAASVIRAGAGATAAIPMDRDPRTERDPFVYKARDTAIRSKMSLPRLIGMTRRAGIVGIYVLLVATAVAGARLAIGNGTPQITPLLAPDVLPSLTPSTAAAVERDTPSVGAAAALPTPAPPTAAPLPTATRLPTATPVPPVASLQPTVTPVPGVGVFGAGTTDDGTLQTVRPVDVVNRFVAGQAVYAFVNYGGAQPSKDQFELMLVANGTQQQSLVITVPSAAGFVIAPLGQLVAAEYRLDVRYQDQLEMEVPFTVAPRPTPASSLAVSTASPPPPHATQPAVGAAITISINPGTPGALVSIAGGGEPTKTGAATVARDRQKR